MRQRLRAGDLEDEDVVRVVVDREALRARRASGTRWPARGSRAPARARGSSSAAGGQWRCSACRTIVAPRAYSSATRSTTARPAKRPGRHGMSRRVAAGGSGAPSRTSRKAGARRPVSQTSRSTSARRQDAVEAPGLAARDEQRPALPVLGEERVRGDRGERQREGAAPCLRRARLAGVVAGVGRVRDVTAVVAGVGVSSPVSSPVSEVSRASSALASAARSRPVGSRCRHRSASRRRPAVPSHAPLRSRRPRRAGSYGPAHPSPGRCRDRTTEPARFAFSPGDRLALGRSRGAGGRGAQFREGD